MGNNISGLFHGARDFTIHDSTLMEVHGNYTLTEVHGNSITNNYTITGPVTDDMTPLPPLKNSSLLFTGRDQYLERLKDYFQVGSPASNVPSTRRSFLLYGMGGVGKTQISLRFIEDAGDCFSHIFWVDASSETSIYLTFKQIAKAQCLHEPTSEAALVWLSKLTTNWLLIFDNADGNHEIVEKFIPHGNKGGNVLITSRNKAMGRITSNNSLHVDQMREDEAVLLLQKCGDLDSDSEDISKRIVSALGYVPLAIDQAGAFIQACQCHPDTYLEMFNTQRQKLMLDPFKGASNYGHSAYGTWEISLKEIESRATSSVDHIAQAAQSALMLHSLFGFFNSDNISQDIFREAAENYKKRDVEYEVKSGLPLLTPLLDSKILYLDEQGAWDGHAFLSGIQVLLSFSLIQSNNKNKSYSVHPLVHSWSRDRHLEPVWSENWHKARAMLTCSAMHALSDLRKDDYVHCRMLLPHFRACHSGQSKVAMDYFDDESVAFVHILCRNGEWEDAIKMKVEIIKKRWTMFGMNPEILTSMNDLGVMLFEAQKLNEAAQLQLQLMEVFTTALGKHNLTTLVCMNNLAMTLESQGKWDEAEKLFKHVVEERKDILGMNHPGYLDSLHNLAALYYHQGKLKEAEQLQVLVLDKLEEKIGKNNLRVLATMAELAVTYSALGKWNKAEDMEVKVLEERKIRLGTAHPDTLRSMNNLAVTYWKQGRFDESEKLQKQVLNVLTAKLGENHINTILSMNNLALAYTGQGKWKEAEELEVKVVEGRKLELGEDHFATLISMNNLATTYFYLGKLDEALKLQENIMEISKIKNGQNHPETLRTMNNLSILYGNQGKWDEAEKLQLEVIEGRKLTLGEDHPDSLESIA